MRRVDAERDGPEFKHRTTAELENPNGDAEGVLVTVGGETGGYALVIQDAKPAFHYNWLGRERYTIASMETLPDGPCTIRFDFAYDGGGAGKATQPRPRPPTRLLLRAHRIRLTTTRPSATYGGTKQPPPSAARGYSENVQRACNDHHLRVHHA